MKTVKIRIASLLILACLLPGLLSPTVATAQPVDDTQAAAEPGARDNLDLLLRVIEDDASRAALVEELKAARAEAEAPADDQVVETLAEASGQNEPSESLSLSRRIAEITQAVAQDLAAGLSSSWAQIARAPAVFDGFSGTETGILLEALQQLGLIIVATVAVFVLLRRIGKGIYARMGAKAGESGFVRTAALFLASGVIDALIVVVAWAIGYAIATFALGTFG